MSGMNQTKKTFGSFHVKDFEIALPIEIIQEVVNYPTQVTPVPLSPQYLLGMFNLRGRIIPIVNISTVLGLKTYDEDLTSKKIAITQYHDVHVGLLFDATSEIIKVSEEDLKQVSYHEPSTHPVIRGFLKLEGGARLLHLISPEDLIRLEDIPHVVNKIRASGSGEKGKASQKKSQGISFQSGDTKMLISMEDIFEIIKVPNLLQSFVNYPYSVGMVNLRGMMIPVIDFGKFLNASGAPKEAGNENKRIMILAKEEWKLGLLIDSVESIIGYSPDEVMPVSQLGQERMNFYQGLLGQEGEEVLIVDGGFFKKHHEVSQIVKGHAKLYQDDHKLKAQSRKNAQRETFISFRIDSEYCFPILEIREIINLPASYTKPIGAPAYMLGIHHLRGQAITLMDLKLLNGGIPPERREEQKVIILRKDQEFVGLVVDAVEDIFSVYSHEKHPCPDLMKNLMDKKFSAMIREFVLVQKEEENKKVVVLESSRFFEPALYKSA